MSTHINHVIGNTLLSVLFITSVSVAQSSNPDANLLRLLDAVESKNAAPTEVPAAETPAVIDEVIASPDAILISEVSAAPEPMAVEAAEPVAVVAVVEDVAPIAPVAVVDEVVETEAVVPEQTSDNALARVLQSVQAAEERTAVTAETLEQYVAATTPEELQVDDLGMESYDNVSATSYDNLISVRLNKVGLEEAINLFAQLSGANIIVPELTDAAQISVNLKDVEWRPALQSILDSYNYELYQRVSGSNVYSVRRRPAGAPVPQVVETFKLNYATVPNVAALIKQLLPPDAKVSEFASRNMIVVKSTESSLSEVRAVLASIDTVRQQVYIESKFMELSDGAQKDLGIDWSVLKSYGVNAGSMSTTFNHTDSDGTVTTRSYDMNGTQTEADGAPTYVEQGTGSGIFERYQAITPSIQKSTSDLLSQVSTAVIDADNFSLMLSALESSSGANIVSNPKIIVANEEMANISIVTKEPNIKQSRQESMNDTADTITYELDEKQPYFEYGIKLDVIPSINTSSNITLKITPSLTRFVEDKVAGDNTYPVISEKSIETIFSLTSGQTAAIGGLTEISESDIERKVPVLGSIPVLGRLFSWQQTISDQSETIIFVTVGLANTKIIDAESGLPEDSELARRRVILERNQRIQREQDRIYYQALEDDRLEDSLKAMKEQEDRRNEQRMSAMLRNQ